MDNIQLGIFPFMLRGGPCDTQIQDLDAGKIFCVCIVVYVYIDAYTADIAGGGDAPHDAPPPA